MRGLWGAIDTHQQTALTLIATVVVVFTLGCFWWARAERRRDQRRAERQAAHVEAPYDWATDPDFAAWSRELEGSA